ncbi:MAG: hypothetical protein HZA54_03585 [Planctomycetes bacterium]|nr:hypothetical protein [Planctomycetota bacterium]
MSSEPAGSEFPGVPTPIPPVLPAPDPPAELVVQDPGADPFARFVGHNVVIDTRSNFVYLGKVISCDRWFVDLSELDVHDRNEGHSTNEKYVMEARKYGVKVNRRAASIVKEQIVSISRLADIVEY